MKTSDIKAQIQNVIDDCVNLGVGPETETDLRAILSSLERDEIPKPTVEQLKAVGKVFRDNEPKEVFTDSLVWVAGPDYQTEGYLYACSISPCLGKLRWHLKDAPPPPAALDHIADTSKKVEVSPPPAAIRGEGAEPHLSCDGCDEAGCAGCMEPPGDETRKNYRAKEPKAEPVMVSMPIIGGKGNELWLVNNNHGAIALYKAVGRKDFDHIELASGAKVTTLQAFAENDPPVRAWFRKV